MDSAECPQLSGHEASPNPPEPSPYSVICDCTEGTNQIAADPNTARSFRPVPTPETGASPLACSVSQDQDITLQPRDLSLNGKIAGYPVKLLVDTGATITVLNAACFHKIPSLASLKPSTSSVPAINTVSGERLPILGQVTLPLAIKGRCYSWRMYAIEDLGFEVVLGRDSLEDNGAVIDFRNGTV